MAGHLDPARAQGVEGNYNASSGTTDLIFDVTG
jgi:hypothetical protein